MSRLETIDLKIGYDERIIVNNLNISIPNGKITALVGSNGSGKSTILKVMARLMRPTAGCVMLDGEMIHKNPPKKSQRSSRFFLRIQKLQMV